MATSNPYSDTLLMDALRGSLSNAESFGRGFAVAPVGLLGDIEGLLRKGVNFSFGRGGVNVGETPVLPTTEGLLSSIPRMTPRRMETAGMEQIGSAANPRGPINLGRAVASLPSDVARAGKEFLAAGQPARVVPPSIAREGNPIQSAVVLIGDKIFTGRTHGDALNRAVYEGAVRKEGGKYIYPKGAEVNSDLFMTNSGQIIDRLQASKMFDIGASETAIEKGLMQNKPSGSMSVDQYMEQAQAIKKQKEATPSFQYPQQEALNLAQQRAALPVEQGGLGLLAENTPEMRAKAMGFDLETYHGTDAPNIESLDPKRTKIIEGVFSAFHPKTASMYAESAAEKGRAGVESAPNVMPLLLNSPSHFQMPEFNKQIIDSLRNSGYAGVQRPEAGVAVTFDPAQIRSRFAAFDPFRKDVATATAMGVALPDLLAAENNQQPQSAGLLYPLP